MQKSPQPFFFVEDELVKAIALANSLIFNELNDKLSEDTYNLLVTCNSVIANNANPMQKDKYFMALYDALESQTTTETINLFSWLAMHFLKSCGENFFNNYFPILCENKKIQKDTVSASLS